MSKVKVMNKRHLVRETGPWFCALALWACTPSESESNVADGLGAGMGGGDSSRDGQASRTDAGKDGEVGGNDPAAAGVPAGDTDTSDGVPDTDGVTASESDDDDAADDDAADDDAADDDAADDDAADDDAADDDAADDDAADDDSELPAGDDATSEPQESSSDESVPGDMHFKVDQFGYLPSDPKVVVISQASIGQFAPDDFQPGATLEVRSWPSESVVFSGSAQPWNELAVDTNSGDRGWWFDFSEVTEPGRYVVYDLEQGLYSHVFRINDDVYRVALVQAMRTYFYQREGFAKELPFADARWADSASHLNDKEARDIFDSDNIARTRDVSGGWMDAGDYNKYVTFLDGVLHVLLASYQLNAAVWGDAHNIPESGNGIPDILDEISFELEWLKKMQDTDGGVFIKSGDNEHYAASPPSSHDYPRFYGMKCSSSTISFAAMLAHSALVFRDVPGLSSQVEELTERASSAWQHYLANPRSDACDSGEIKSGDADRSLAEQDDTAIRAAMWLFALTEESVYHDYFLDNYALTEQFSAGWWGPYNLANEDALLFYSSLPTAEAGAAADILANRAAGAGDPEFYTWVAASSLYRGSMPDWAFHWGSNNARASSGTLNTNIIDYDLDVQNNAAYRQRALEQVHWLHGVNPLGKVMLSNMYEFGAEDCVNSFFHTWFTEGTEWHSALTGSGPAPGYLVGGPNAAYTGGQAPPSGEPPAKSYVDGYAIDSPWEINENGIYYQAAYIRLLAHFVTPARPAP